MKTFFNSTVATAVACLSLFSCTQQDEELSPNESLKVSQQSDLVGFDPTTCNLIQSFGTGELPRAVDVIEENRAIFTVKAQRRGHNGKYLNETSAVLLDPQDPATNLLNPFDTQMAGVYGLLTVGDESGLAANETGGRVILDFTPVSSVTMKTLVVADIEESEAGSKVQLFSSTGQLLDEKPLPVTGDKGLGFVSFDNVPGVAKVIVTFGYERQKSGSGAIARLQLCIEGEGVDDFCFQSINSVWMQYTGSNPANITVKAKEGAASKVVYSGKGVKPGTMFKLENAAGFGEALVVETQRKDKETIPMTCNGPTSLKKQYGNFKLVEVRSGAGMPLLLQ
ncbi:hypothetical protein FVR03_05180 [Pontibacter qinzhouensis]|uniref:Uncharacterized protein n=1 Tax=Pontibacter qinzhouensis TaxID=2603253 RepID=A0A5C8KAJ9_9BACT|nr:hypothetical protein [Pontibacter qinzhouensis]TXK50285.1 hypothetical protein FVR03_05180 [Pontibacter qinzhouensis]